MHPPGGCACDSGHPQPCKRVHTAAQQHSAVHAGAFYMRLVGRPLEVYQYLEPLYNDYRKIRMQTTEGTFVLTHVDELIDEMLRKDFLFDIALPRVPARCVPHVEMDERPGVRLHPAGSCCQVVAGAVAMQACLVHRVPWRPCPFLRQR